MPDSPDSHTVRLDRWLWAARFFKTRSLAAQAIGGGKVQVNGHRVKRAKTVHVGDEIRVRRGPFEHCVIVQDLSERRGPAKEAQGLYEETAESLHKRETLATQIKSIPKPTFREKGRPTKRERREIDRFKRGGSP
jgi:ribosome-associated heat shock protein Hsp15